MCVYGVSVYGCVWVVGGVSHNPSPHLALPCFTPFLIRTLPRLWLPHTRPVTDALRCVQPRLLATLVLAVYPVSLSPFQMSEVLNRIPDRIAGEPEDHVLPSRGPGPVPPEPS